MLFSIIYKIVLPLLRLYYRVIFLVSVKGRENIPKDGAFLVCPNHKSNNDPPLVAAFLIRRLKFLGKAELFSTKISNWFLSGIGVLPVTRSSSDIGIVKTSLRILMDGHPMMIFPEGKRNLDDVTKSKSGSVMLSIRTKAPILPVYIEGEYKPFHKMNLYFGKPICFYENCSKRPTPDELHSMTMELMDKIYNLKEEF